MPRGRGCPPATTRSPGSPRRSPRRANGPPRRRPPSPRRRTRSVTSTPPRSAWTRRTRRPPRRPRPPQGPDRRADRRAARAAKSEASTLQARVEALSLGLDRQDGTQALLAAGGPTARACSAASPTRWTSPRGSRPRSPRRSARSPKPSPSARCRTRVQALELLRANGSGRAGVLIQGPRSRPDRRGWPELPDGAPLGGRPARRPRRAAAGAGPGAGPGRRRARHGHRGRACSTRFRTSGRSPPTAT